MKRCLFYFGTLALFTFSLILIGAQALQARTTEDRDDVQEVSDAVATPSEKSPEPMVVTPYYAQAVTSYRHEPMQFMDHPATTQVGVVDSEPVYTLAPGGIAIHPGTLQPAGDDGDGDTPTMVEGTRHTLVPGELEADGEEGNPATVNRVHSEGLVPLGSVGHVKTNPPLVSNEVQGGSVSEEGASVAGGRSFQMSGGCSMQSMSGTQPEILKTLVWIILATIPAWRARKFFA